MREYFGRSRFGTIFGFTMALSALGNILGPPFAGWVFDNWGSYDAAWLVLAFLAFTATIIVVTTPPVGTNVQMSDDA